MADACDLKRISVLVISPPAKAQGGVAAFAETMKKYLQGCDVTSLHVGRDGGEGAIASALRFCSALCRLIYYVCTKRVDVVHVNPSLNYKSLARDGLILLCLRAIRFTRVMVWFHGWELAVEKHIRQGKFHCRFFTWLLGGVKRVVVLAPEFRQSLMEMGVNGESITLGTTMFDGTSIRARFNETDGCRKILFMSRYDARKGIYELLDAFENVARDFPDAQLVLAGDGPEYLKLRARIEASESSGRITLFGYETGNAKSLLLAGCVIFALPSYYPEGMPVALLEALASGMPVLTAKSGGIRHIVSEPENGVVLDVVTAKTVETGLRRLLNDKDYCKETGQRNAASVWRKYEAKIVTAQIEKLYYEIAAD